MNVIFRVCRFSLGPEAGAEPSCLLGFNLFLGCRSEVHVNPSACRVPVLEFLGDRVDA